MKFDTRAIVLVTARLVKLAEKPPLFNERMPPARIARRLDRVLNWLGTGGRVITAEYIRCREVPSPGKPQWSRWDWARPSPLGQIEHATEVALAKIAAQR